MSSTLIWWQAVLLVIVLYLWMGITSSIREEDFSVFYPAWAWVSFFAGMAVGFIIWGVK